MKGLDTNVLLRYLTGDDPAQSERAEAVFAEAERTGDRLFLATVALCEVVWMLRSRPFRADRGQITEVVERLLKTAVFEIQDRTLVRRALADYRTGEGDFADYLLVRTAQDAGCTETMTFDRALAGTPGVALLS